MKLNRSSVLAFILLILVAALYRVWEGRPAGFAPQMAMAIFAGATIKDRRWALLMPLLSMLLSDVLYEILYVNGLSTIKGFYSGIWANYVLLVGLTCFGFLMKRITALSVLGFSLSGSVLFFVFSNFFVWLGGGGLGRPLTFEGLLLCYQDALAFYREYGLINGFAGNFLIGEVFFSAVLFGSFMLLRKPIAKTSVA